MVKKVSRERTVKLGYPRVNLISRDQGRDQLYASGSELQTRRTSLYQRKKEFHVASQSPRKRLLRPCRQLYGEKPHPSWCISRPGTWRLVSFEPHQPIIITCMTLLPYNACARAQRLWYITFSPEIWTRAAAI